MCRRKCGSDGYLDLPSGKSEMETLESVSALAEKNHVFHTCLRGAGSYRHYIPAAVKAIVNREEFVDRLHALSGGDQPGHFAGDL